MPAAVWMLCLLLVSCHAEAPAAAEVSGSSPAPAVARVIEADADTVLPGATRPDREVTLSTSFDSLLAEVLVEEGVRVRKGEVIAVLDDRVARVQVRVAEQQASATGAIQRAEATLTRAREILMRTESAHASSVANDDELDEARNRLALAEAELQQARETHERAGLELELARARLEEHLIRAPFDAVVVRVHADPGAVLATGEPVAELVSPARVRVDLHLPASAALGVRIGEHVAVELEEPLGAVLPARVRYVEPRIDPISRTQRVVLAFDGPLAHLPLGLLVRPASRVPTDGDLSRVRAMLGERAWAVAAASTVAED